MMKKGFTYVEIVIAISIFVLVTIISSNILLNFSSLEKKTSIQNIIYEDIRIIISQLSSLIESGSIDYEEYFSMNVIQRNNDTKFYGIYNGIYSSRFHSPGLSGGTNPANLGSICSDDDCKFIMQESVDFPTGINPYNNDHEASAFCDNSLRPNSCGDLSNTVDELYLIDKTGRQKTIIGKKLIQENQYALAILEMTGNDYDQNGIVDLFSCTDDFNCSSDIYSVLNNYPFVENQGFINSNNISLAKQNDLSEALNLDTTEFIPISPLRINIQELSFTINPIENPYLAYNEETNLFHPSVTISLTVDLSEEEKINYPGDFEPISFSTTISAGVVGEIVSYPPIEDTYGDAGTSWIDEII